ncbi:MAG: FAD:protein FMN transferase [Dactylosporangium sp.]|nr:FAD:protein FMN transferase [Dactylosporangium sp.]NNJ60044.1 FAD:protein FMN transferase [Dactylosporangium sp.]
MNMPISIHLRGAGLASPEVERAVAEVFADLRRVEGLFSTFRPDSQVSAINRGQARPGDCHPLVAEVIELCGQARERTDGYFDAYLPRPGGSRWFNPAGLVKGWAAERAAGWLRALPRRGFCLNAGGDIVVGGSGPREGEPWTIGIEDPLDTGHLVATVSVPGGAVATSGGTHRGGHIVVPSTGVPAGELLTATVTGPSLMWADVFATAAVARGAGALRWLTRLPGYAGMVVRPGGAALVTPGWPAGASTALARPPDDERRR